MPGFYIPANWWYSAGMAKKQASKPTTAKPGPKPDTLKIEGNWEAAMKKSLDKKRPPGGWPK
jgi:hypothetical protein